MPTNIVYCLSTLSCILILYLAAQYKINLPPINVRQAGTYIGRKVVKRKRLLVGVGAACRGLL
jgi:hypothetical protein